MLKKVPGQLVTSCAIQMATFGGHSVNTSRVAASKCVHSQACEGQCQRNRIKLLQWNRWTSHKKEKHGENIHDTALSCYAECGSQKLRVNLTVKI